MVIKGLITKVNSDTFTVKCDNGFIIDCKSRGKFRSIKLKPLVGDNVLVDDEKRVIEEVFDRKNCLSRPPVSNVDIALIVTSIKKPDLNLLLLDKLISIVIINKIEPVIVFTKIDLLNKKEKKELKLISDYYKKIGIKVYTNKQIFRLKRYISNKIITVCGQTGAGKSTLINKFDKRLNLETNEISKSLGRGIHTTRIVELFEIKNFYIVDTPGFSKIDIDSYEKNDIKNSFYEFKRFSCKFKDCNHINEEGCSIIKEIKRGKLLKSRYDNYLRFIGEKNDIS